MSDLSEASAVEAMAIVAADLRAQADNISPTRSAHPAPFMRDCADRIEAALAALKPFIRGGVPEGWVCVPREPTEAMWGYLARDIVMWDRFQKHGGSDLYGHLRSLGREIPDWLTKEIPDTDQVPPKGTVAAVIYKAMLSASPSPPDVEEG